MVQSISTVDRSIFLFNGGKPRQHSIRDGYRNNQDEDEINPLIHFKNSAFKKIHIKVLVRFDCQD